jgi:hypothetical protein
VAALWLMRGVSKLIGGGEEINVGVIPDRAFHFRPPLRLPKIAVSPPRKSSSTPDIRDMT